MSASIRLSEAQDTVVPAGITAGKSYTVQGVSGGGVVIVNDDGKFAHVSFSDIDTGWVVTDESAEDEDDYRPTDDEK
jgi:hypothetical protein